MRVIAAWVVVSVVTGSLALAAEPAPNAALRYWMAFAQMENPPASGELAKRLESVADGKEPWAESLAPILDRNHEALATLQRGSRLPSCDWGYEHELMAEAPIANVARARALARLNVLHGLRLWQQGRRTDAVEAWLAGVRFSRHIAADGPWLSVLVASGSLRAHLGALTRAAGEKKLEPAIAARIEQEIAALPEAGFDWSVAARIESEGSSALASHLERSADPQPLLSQYFQDVALPADRQALRETLRRTRELNDELRPRLVAAFQAPPESAREMTRELDARANQDPLLGHMWPRSERINQSRGEVAQARAELLALLRTR